jgi:hypothetical protein
MGQSKVYAPEEHPKPTRLIRSKSHHIACAGDSCAAMALGDVAPGAQPSTSPSCARARDRLRFTRRIRSAAPFEWLRSARRRSKGTRRGALPSRRVRTSRARARRRRRRRLDLATPRRRSGRSPRPHRDHPCWRGNAGGGEWAWEEFDEATAAWCFQRLGPDEEAGWLHRRRDEWVASGQSWSAYVRAWAGEERLHSATTLLRLLDERFEPAHLERGPYFFPDLARATEDDERAAIEAGQIRATRVDYVGTRR